MSQLFSELKIRDLRFKNRIFVSPMCQYSAKDGVPQPWHFVHLGSRAVGGAALVMSEATSVSAVGRISPSDAGLWNDEQVNAFKPICDFIRSQGSIAGIQMAHAGRKGSTAEPWNGGKTLKSDEGPWTTIAPSAIAFGEYTAPREMTEQDIGTLVEDFSATAKRAERAGFQVIELHFAHGYLLHEFLSPLANHRIDQYGGSFENRIRLPLEIATRLRKEWPQGWPIFVRISASDWAPGGWDIEQSVAFAKRLKSIGIDLVDCSSGGIAPHIKIPTEPGYQVPFAEAVRREAGVLSGAVGLITDARQAEEILATGRADVVFLARQLLRDPYWPLHAAKELGVDLPWPKQYDRAKN
jgi:2,4-dienoyl-CoA reductase-like NADH-dependent reductase (Old Yellow Enzyme family)